MSFNYNSIISGIGSIIKNYCLHEESTMTMSLYVLSIQKLNNIGFYQATGSMKDIGKVLSNLHVDYDYNDVPTIYDVPCCSIIELRGERKTISIPRKWMNLMLDHVITGLDKNSALYHVGQLYLNHIGRHNKFKFDILGYMAFMFKQPREVDKLFRVLDNLHEDLHNGFNTDIEDLKEYSVLDTFDLK